jgi:hypothetical protein
MSASRATPWPCGERKLEKDEKEENYRRIERQYETSLARLRCPAR